MFTSKFIVRKHERGLLFKDGDFLRFLAPGTYRFWNTPRRYTVEINDVTFARFEHRLSDFLAKDFEEDVKRLFQIVETSADEVAVIYEKERLVDVIGPASRAFYWKGVVDVKTMLIDIAEVFKIDNSIAKVIAILCVDQPTVPVWSVGRPGGRLPGQPGTPPAGERGVVSDLSPSRNRGSLKGQADTGSSRLGRYRRQRVESNHRALALYH